MTTEDYFVVNSTQAFFIRIDMTSSGITFSSSELDSAEKREEGSENQTSSSKTPFAAEKFEPLTLSVAGSADLPDWLSYSYEGSSNKFHNVAYLFGTATRPQNVEIEVIALNRNSLETLRKSVRLSVIPKQSKKQPREQPFNFFHQVCLTLF